MNNKKKILNKLTEQLDFDSDGFLGIEVEEEDKEVGIFGNTFCLGFKNDKGEKLWLTMSDDTFDSMLDKLKPFIDDRESLMEFEHQESK